MIETSIENKSILETSESEETINKCHTIKSAISKKEK